LLAADRKFDGNPPEIIGALAISKQTYYGWLDELGLPKVSKTPKWAFENPRWECESEIALRLAGAH
jgi:hypothetical protein